MKTIVLTLMYWDNVASVGLSVKQKENLSEQQKKKNT